MDSNWKAIGVMTAVIVVVILVAAAIVNSNDDWRGSGTTPSGGSGDSSQTEPPVGGIVYNVSDLPVVTDSDRIRYPPEGMEYITVIYIISNLYCDEGIHNNPYYFELIINGLSYTYDSVTYSHQLYNPASAVYPGYTLESVLVFEVPEGTDFSDATLVYDGIPHSGIILQKVESEVPDFS